MPLGYEVRDRKLVVSQEEAGRVRHIMRRYLEAPSVNALIGALRDDGVVTKVQQRISGPHKGGISFARGSLFHLLKNRIYLGMIVHKGEAYPGEHEAIVDQQLWDAVQDKLARKAPPRTTERNGRQRTMLRGMLFDGHGRPMVVTPAKKGNRRYRYYASSRAPGDDVPVVRVGLDACESTIIDQLATFLSSDTELQRALAIDDASRLAAALQRASGLAKEIGDPNNRPSAQSLVLKATFNSDSIRLHLDRSVLDPESEMADLRPIEISAAFTARRWSREARMTFGAEQPNPLSGAGESLIALLDEARRAQSMVLASPDRSLSALAKRENISRRQLNRLIKLSYLSPRIVESILGGQVPARLTRTRLLETPLLLDWRDQERAVGLQ